MDSLLLTILIQWHDKNAVKQSFGYGIIYDQDAQKIDATSPPMVILILHISSSVSNSAHIVIKDPHQTHHLFGDAAHNGLPFQYPGLFVQSANNGFSERFFS